MTAVVGLVHDGIVWIGGDSAGVGPGYSLTVRADAKVFTVGDYIFGFTDSFRMGQLLRYSLTLPKPPSGDLHRFMATDFIDAVRKCLTEGGWARKSDEQERGGNFLVGVNGRLFEVMSDYQVAEPVDLYAAVGCGYELALGAMYATEWTGQTPRQRIELALKAAERFSGGVRGPFLILSGAAVAVAPSSVGDGQP